MSNKEIAAHIDCNPSQVSHICIRAGLASKKTLSKFSEKDIQYAVDNYHTMSNSAIAAEIGCSPTMVAHLIKRAGKPTAKKLGTLSDEDVAYALDNYYTMTNAEIADRIGCSASNISALRTSHGLPRKKVVAAKADIEYALANYDNKSAKAIGEDLGFSRGWVLKTWWENDLYGKENRMYSCNFNYFETIDTENKAYVLGLTAADGNVYKRDGHQGQLRISLKSSDAEILEDVLLDMESNNPVTLYKRKLDNREYASLVIVSDKIFSDLGNLGIYPNKTWDISIENILANIPERYHSDFLRGYVDGDGTITDNCGDTISSIAVSIAIPKDNGEYLSTMINGQLDTTLAFVLDPRIDHYTKPFGNVCCKNTTDKYVFTKYLYQHVEDGSSTLALQRKHKNARILRDKVENNITDRIESVWALEAYAKLQTKGGVKRK